VFFGGIRRSIPSYTKGFGGSSSLHSSTAIGRACTPECLPSPERFVQAGVSARRRGFLAQADKVLNASSAPSEETKNRKIACSLNISHN